MPQRPFARQSELAQIFVIRYRRHDAEQWSRPIALKGTDPQQSNESNLSEAGIDLPGMIGLAVPGRPIRHLVAEDRSAAGIRDRTGPEPDAS
jgi:hypothetical protein